jgi:hypothetical protein
VCTRLRFGCPTFQGWGNATIISFLKKNWTLKSPDSHRFGRLILEKFRTFMESAGGLHPTTGFNSISNGNTISTHRSKRGKNGSQAF